MLLSGAIGMVIFALWPVAPPRLADLGLVDTVTEYSRSYRVLQPPAFTNQYAAMPSLHMGWDLLIGLAIIVAASRLWVRVIGGLLPVLMGWAVVATAEPLRPRCGRRRLWSWSASGWSPAARA